MALVTKTKRLLLQVFVSLLLLGYFSTFVEWHILFAAFGEMETSWYILSTMFAVLGPVIMTAKFHALLHENQQKVKVHFLQLLAINFMVRFYALFVPSSLGSESVRWYKITNKHGSRTFFLSLIIFERVLFVGFLIAFAMLPLLLSQDLEIVELRNEVMLILLLALLGLGFVMAYLVFSSFRHQILINIKRFFRLRDDSTPLLFLSELSVHPTSFGRVKSFLFYTLLWQLSFLLRVYCIVVSLDVALGFWGSSWIASLVMILQTLPITFAGLGVREGAYAYLFNINGFSAELGVAVGLLLFSQMLVIASIGWFFQIVERGNNVNKTYL